MKLRIDQSQQDKVEAYRKEMSLKYEKEKRSYEEQRQRKLFEIQDSIENLNLATSDKQKLKTEIDDLIQEQNTLQSKIDTLKQEQEEEDSKNRQLQREINELNIQMNANRVTGVNSSRADTDGQVQELRDQIARKNL